MPPALSIRFFDTQLKLGESLLEVKATLAKSADSRVSRTPAFLPLAEASRPLLCPVTLTVLLVL